MAPPPEDTAVLDSARTGETASTADTAVVEPWVVYASDAIAFEDWVEPEGLGMGAAIIDTNLDGQLDVVLAGGQNVWVFSPLGATGPLTIDDAIYKIPFEGGPGMSTADFDEDGHVDLMTFGGSTASSVTISLNFTPFGSGKATLNTNGFGHWPVAFDADNDGHLDVVRIQDAQIAFFYGPFVAGEVREPETLLRFEGPDAVAAQWLVAAGDMNGDGIPDLVIRDYAKQHVLPGPIPRVGTDRTRGLYRVSSGTLRNPIAMESVDASGASGLWLWRVNPGDEFTLPTLMRAPVADDDWQAFATLVGDDAAGIQKGDNVGDVTGNGLPDFMGAFRSDEWRLFEGGVEGPIDALHGARLRIVMEGEYNNGVLASDIDGNGVSDYLTYASTKAMLFMNPPLRPK